MFAEIEAALKLHSMMAEHMAGSRLQKGGAWKTTCADRDEGTVESVDAMEAGAVDICMLVVYSARNYSGVSDAIPHRHVQWTLLRHNRYSWVFQGTAGGGGLILGTGENYCG